MNSTVRKPKGLGRGLDALFNTDEPGRGSPHLNAEVHRLPGMAQVPPGLDDDPADAQDLQVLDTVESDSPLRLLPLSALRPGRYQPRTRMDEGALQELADSILQHGVLQPVVVRPIAGDQFEIIAGERRFRAAQLAGIETVPALIREVSDENALALALIENIQREDLNPLEEAAAIQRLIDEFAYTHERASQAIGRSRSSTTNLLRLLNLAEPVQTMLLAGDIEMGHARALLAVDRSAQVMLATEVIQKRMTVRETERLVQQHQAGRLNAASGRKPPPSRDLVRLQERLSDVLGTPVEIQSRARGSGRLVIHFHDNDVFSGLLSRLHLEEVLNEAGH